MASDKTLWKIFSEFIRRRDADANGMCKCFTCGLIRHWKQMDCGHGVDRQFWGTRYNEKNNHAQCKKCNGFEGGKKDVYAAEVDRRYGAGTWDVLNASKHQRKYRQFEIDILTKLYRDKLSDLKLS